LTRVILIDSDVLIWLTLGQQSAKARLSKINPWRFADLRVTESDITAYLVDGPLRERAACLVMAAVRSHSRSARPLGVDR
jgi:hypothetical protein